MRFFNIGLDDVAAMTPQMTRYYIQAMEIIEARERLKAMDVAIYPKIEASERRKKHRELYKKAYPDSFSNRPLKTTDLELI